MIYTNRVGTSFLIESLNIKDSLFRQQYYQTNVLPFSHNGPQSSSIDFKKISSIRAAIGEQLERSSIYINNKRFKDFFVNGIDMLTGDEVRVPTYRLLLNWAIPLFNELDLSDLYNDTCGAASHIDSFNTINTAFLECFERQCLLYNWFTQSPGKRLDISLLNDIPEVSRIIRMAKQHVEEVHLFDISLYDGIKVIITLAFGKETKGVGLCAGWNYKNAILGSLKELFQYITVDVKSIDEIDSDFDKDNVSNPLFYGLHFLKEVDSVTLKNDFKYLIENSPLIRINLLEFDSVYEENFTEVLRNITDTYELDFILCYIPSLNNLTNTKIVKVITNKGFHHMFAAKINPYNVPFLSTAKGGFYNIGKMIPFG